MIAPVEIVIEPGRRLSLAAEAALLEAALERDPAAPGLRQRLAHSLIEDERFDQAIALCDGQEPERLDFAMCLTQARARIARRAAGDAEQTLALATRAVALAASASERAHALAEQGAALVLVGRKAAGMVSLAAALAEDQTSRAAFKRLSVQLLREARYAEAETLAGELIEAGIGHTRVLATLAFALMVRGEIAAARTLIGVADFATAETLPVPPGWSHIAAFNAQVAEEILTNPGLRHDRYGTASRRTARVDSPAGGATPAVDALLAAIARAAERHIAALGDGPHPWLKARPQRLELRSWCVITEAAGHEDWHMHPAGWMSGGYYLAVPDAVVTGEDAAGCLGFGLPGGYIGAAQAQQFGEVLVRPRPGLLNLFPSHAHHRTHPHRAAGRRMCLAFDLCPV